LRRIDRSSCFVRLYGEEELINFHHISNTHVDLSNLALENNKKKKKIARFEKHRRRAFVPTSGTRPEEAREWSRRWKRRACEKERKKERNAKKLFFSFFKKNADPALESKASVSGRSKGPYLVI
jgi:hypothetical protein